MSLTTFAILLSAIGIPMSWRYAIAYLRDPVSGMAMTQHRPEKLVQVMPNRYVAFAAMATAATLYQDLNVIAFLGGCFALMAFWDAMIYSRGGHPIREHLIAGIAAAVVAAVAIYAQLMNGVAA